MEERNKIDGDITLTENLKMLAQAYEELAVMKMQSTRDSVLKTRNFLDELSYVFYDVKSNFRHQLEELMKHSKKKDQNITSFSTLPNNGREVAVLVSAKAKLYGDIVTKVFHYFVEQVNSHNEIDIIIIGKLGQEMYNQIEKKRNYTFFELSDTDSDIEALKPIISEMVKYKKITVYHGKFVNVINQEPMGANISGEQPIESVDETQTITRYLFEPDLTKILNFFETQIFSSLFKQAIHEAQLSRYASRIKAMEEALGNIDKDLSKLGAKKIRAKNLYMNKKQTEVISGISLWSGNR